MPEDEYIISSETDRQYRLVKMYVDVHSYLRDCFSRVALVCELVLLVFSVIACAFTFTGDDFYKPLGWNPTYFRYGLGAFSILSFCGSLVLLLLNPKSHANDHQEAARKWAIVLALFRKANMSGKLWQRSLIDELHREYYRTGEDVVSIPSTKFNKLKSKYLLKVELSKLKSEYVGCPRFLLWGMIRGKDTLRFLKDGNKPRCRDEKQY